MKRTGRIVVERQRGVERQPVLVSIFLRGGELASQRIALGLVGRTEPDIGLSGSHDPCIIEFIVFPITRATAQRTRG